MSLQGYEQLKLEKSIEVAEVLDCRHILDDEMKMVIHDAESTGEKLYQPEGDRFLAKKRIGEVTYYVEYSIGGKNTYIVHTAYSHRAEVKEE